MSKADAADSDSTVREHRQRGLIPWKPGESGNPKGRPQGSRNKLSEDFIADLHESWKSLGKPALLAAAWTDPVAYVRVVASLIPRELETTITPVAMERMSDAQLEAIIARCIEEDGLDPASDG
ncbi:MAG TPA: DUF5681 domain-containing protein [Pseudolabrys sp.]|nr:DUF5681 domain-containing protein [Pseudolabrys sp.]